MINSFISATRSFNKNFEVFSRLLLPYKVFKTLRPQGKVRCPERLFRIKNVRGFIHVLLLAIKLNP